MKVLKNIGLVLSLTILAAACNPKDKHVASVEQHKQSSHAAAETPSNLHQEAPVAGVPVLSNADLDAVYQQYQHLTAALVNENSNTAKLAALAIETGARHIKGAGSLAKAAAAISGTSDLKAQRLAFASLNEAFIGLVKSTGLDSGRLYIAHCPMALNDQGASWVSQTKEIKNPYFGESMLTCGSVTETL